jgi:tRNA threonylcarbamoyladenosine biosynthesis protein TsaB
MYSILCIETATEICSVAIVNATKVVALEEISEGNMHASQLTTLIQKALLQAGITLSQLEAIAVSKGPGSYTGLRVGVSTAKGLCYALDKPLIGINTLESLASLYKSSIKDQTPRIIPMLDARRMEVYCAMHDNNGNQITPTEAKIIDETAFAEELENAPIYFIGNGTAKCKTMITHPNAFFIDDIQCSAKGMWQLATRAYEQKQFEDVAYFEPFYLKDFIATTPKKRF